MFYVNTKSKTVILVENSLLIAIAFVLSYIRFDLPFGGSVTVVSMLPILLIGIRHGTLWGVASALVYSGLQLLQSFRVPPSNTITALIFMILLDYIVAFGSLGLSGLFRNKNKGLIYSVPLCLGLRYICHVLSGIVLWNSYRWEGWSVFAYSLAYNAIYMIPELLITFLIAVILYKSKLHFL